MGLQEYNIIFDNPNAMYYAGQTVTGRLEIRLDSPKKVRSILVKFKGEARVRWTEQRAIITSRGSRFITVYLTAEEEYLKVSNYCLGGLNTGTTELPIGLHVYNFALVLPPDLPPTFKDEYGHIRYTVKAVIVRPWKFNHKKKLAFTVLSHYDLNTNPRLREPVSIMMEKYMYCCCCMSGPLTCVVTLRKSGYVSGESIDIFVEINNNSNAAVKNVKLKLQKVITCYSQQPRKDFKKKEYTIQSSALGPVCKKSSQFYTRSIVVPPLPPSNLANCSIIHLDYQIKIVVKMTGAHMKLSRSIPVSIGTIPLDVT